MADNNHHPPGVEQLLGRIGRTSLGLLENRGELLTLEWQEEKGRLLDLLVWGVAMVFFAIMGMLLLTATIIFLFKEEWRLYVVAGFTVLYLAAAFGAWMALRNVLKREPFAETLEQVRKDRLWLESLK